MLKIGDIELKGGIGLAPMAGVTDMVYRTICMEHGADFCMTELISAKAVLYNNKNTKTLLATCKEEAPCALQLFGSDPEIMGTIAGQLKDLPFAWVDINMGCPVPKVVNNGEGSALMKDPVLVGRIVESMVQKAGKPVTVKIRSGFDEDNINACEIARVAEESGAAAVMVHARTRQQYYGGEADRSVIESVKKAVRIPVIGNGDIANRDDIKAMEEQTGCDGVLIGRAARGNPWIFEKDYTDKKSISIDKIKETMLIHLEAMTLHKGEYTAVREMRKHFGWYTAGLKFASSLRRDVNCVETKEGLRALIDKL